MQGRNAQGKTNLLEAIYYLATSRSPHAGAERELVNWLAVENEPLPYARLVGQVVRGASESTIEITLTDAVNLRLPVLLDPASLAANPELLSRIARNELFTLGRHYTALSATIEATPLLLFIPTVFVNLSDGSALAQVVTQYDLREDLLMLGALNLPIGPEGTEFGGIETGEQGTYLSSGLSLFAQLNWYF